jgi:hypothetical protein
MPTNLAWHKVYESAKAAGVPLLEATLLASNTHPPEGFEPGKVEPVPSKISDSYRDLGIYTMGREKGEAYFNNLKPATIPGDPYRIVFDLVTGKKVEIPSRPPGQESAPDMNDELCSGGADPDDWRERGGSAWRNHAPLPSYRG